MGRIAATVAVLALVIAGCGDDAKSDEQAIKDTVRTYFTAFADGDGARACDQLSSTVRDVIEQKTKDKDCATALELAAKQPAFKRYIGDLREVEIQKVTISGNAATAKVKAIGQTTTMPLSKVGDKWKIEASEVAPGG
jgi:ketosteroid isomerase-like protein